METPVYNVYDMFNRPPHNDIIVDGESAFVPDQAMTIYEIMERAARGLLSDTNVLQEIPDDIGEFYDDFTDMLIPEEDDVTDIDPENKTKE